MRRSPSRRSLLPALLLVVLWLPGSTACGGEAGARATEWAGTMDTLASGQIVVRNPSDPLWGEDEGWTVTEDLRIGALDDPGPYGFGQIIAIDVDALGRIWVLESQAKEIRVFDADGRHVRTVGRAGGGPGEFNGPAHAEFGRDGRLWVADPQNNRVSVIDTTGAFVESHRMEGGFFISPWPGGFDLEGRYYLPIPHFGSDGFGVATVRYDADFQPLDTIPQLSDPVHGERFELRDGEGGGIIASVPFTAGFGTSRSPQGTMWGLLTGEYRLFEIVPGGDTLRTVLARYDPLPVTSEDRETARETLKWFTDQGGKIDISRIPGTKPAAWSMFVDDEGRIWVDRITAHPNGQDFDIFDPEGRFLGRVQLPVPLGSPRLVVGDHIYGVTRDDLGVPYVVRVVIAERRPG